MDMRIFRRLSSQQRRCDHHFEEIASRYDPDAEPNIICAHCGVRHSDYAAQELNSLERKRRDTTNFHDRSIMPRHRDDRDVRHFNYPGSDLTARTVLVRDVEPRAKSRIIACGGNVMYCDQRDFQYAVLMPAGTEFDTQNALYHLPNGDVIFLSECSSDGYVHGHELIYAPLHSTMLQTRRFSEVKRYGPLGRRAHSSATQTRSY